MTKLLTKSQRLALAKTAKESGTEVRAELDGVVLTFRPLGEDTYPDVVNLSNYRCDK